MASEMEEGNVQEATADQAGPSLDQATADEANTNLNIPVEDVGVPTENSESLEESLIAEPTGESCRKLTVIVPNNWVNARVYTWGPDVFGPWPGETMQKDEDGVYELTIPDTMVNLIISGDLSDGTFQMTEDICLEPNGINVSITVTLGGVAVGYGDPMPSDYRVVGNADWMGNWDLTSDAGQMIEITPNVYRICFPDVAPGYYEFYITKGRTWENAHGDAGDPACIYVGEVCDVTMTLRVECGIGYVDLDYIAVPVDEIDTGLPLPTNF